MSPTIVHRWSWPVREAIEALLGADASDAERWEIRVDGDELVVDIVAPTPAPSIVPTADEAASLDESGGGDAAKGVAPAEPERKGGKLAQRAAIMCGEKGFWNFARERYSANLPNKESAASWMYDRFGISSRVDLDHVVEAGAAFRDVEQAYKMWLDGY